MEIRLSHKRILYLLFFLSGFSALVYEILWTKHLSLTFGTSMVAVSIVAAVFMGGLALGSYLIGRWADRGRDLLRTYAVLELGIALFALLFVPTLYLAREWHTFFEWLFPEHPAITHGIHFFTSGILVLPPTLLMGGTFPLMCRLFARRKCGGQIGRLYALNTLGATLGAFLAGYLLIPTMGLSGTGYLAVFINLIIAGGAYLIGRRLPQPNAPAAAAPRTRGTRHIARENRLCLAAIALVGFLSLAYEILWTRVFLLFLGNTTYAFSLILSAFLVGLSLGGALYARLVRPALDERRLFTLLTVLMGFVVLATLPFYDRLAHLFQWAHNASAGNWWLLTLFSFLIVLLVMSLPTIVSGCLLPAAAAILDPGRNHTGEGVGLVVLCNTLGSMLGSLVAVFVLLHLFSLQDSFRLLGILNLLFAAFLAIRYRPGLRAACASAALIVAGAVLAAWPPAWNQQLMNSGIYVYAAAYAQAGGVEKAVSRERLIAVDEGIDVTVAVNESADGKVRFLAVNGKTDASNGFDMSTQLLIGQLPLMLHPAPQEVMVIGVGSGITLGAVKEFPLRRLDAVEISPGVVRAARLFAKDNRNALDDPRVNLIIDDARNQLLTWKRRYDVIVSQPSNPWQSGNANLFTADFYRLAASRLEDDGLFCQWLGLYDTTPDNLRVAVATFLDTFPKVLAFRANSDLILIGAKDALQFDYLGMKRAFDSPRTGPALQSLGLTSPGLLLARHYLFNDEALRGFSRGAALNTDDMPVLEFSARHYLGKKLFSAFQMANLSELEAAKGRVAYPLTNLGSSPMEIAAALRDLGSSFANDGRHAEAEQFLRKATEVEAALLRPSRRS